MEQLATKLKEAELKTASLVIELSELKTFAYSGLNRIENLVTEKNEKMAKMVKNGSDTSIRGQQAVLELESKLTKLQMRLNGLEKGLDAKVGNEEIMKVSELISREYTSLEKFDHLADDAAKMRQQLHDKVDQALHKSDT
jgi:hypothetical protein